MFPPRDSSEEETEGVWTRRGYQPPPQGVSPPRHPGPRQGQIPWMRRAFHPWQRAFPQMPRGFSGPQRVLPPPQRGFPRPRMGVSTQSGSSTDQEHR